MMEVRRVDKLQVGEVYTEEGSREVRAIRRWTENTVDFKIIRLLQREVGTLRGRVKRRNMLLIVVRSLKALSVVEFPSARKF